MSDQSEINLTSAASPSANGATQIEGQGSRRKARRVQRRNTAGDNETFFQQLPLWMWVVPLVLAALGLLSANPLLTACALVMLPVLASLLWFRGEPPVLLFACFMQWLQATAAVFYTNWYRVPLSVQVEYGGADVAKATWLSLVGVLVLAIGMRLVLPRRRSEIAEQARREGGLLRPMPIFILYLIAFVGFSAIGWVASHVPALAQPLLAVTTLKWVLVFLLAHYVLTQRKHYLFLGIAVCLEFATGILAYFSEFKSIFFILLVVLPSAHYIFKGWRLAQFCFVAALILALGVVWTAIKADYREYLNQGTGEQVALVPVSHRLIKLGGLVGTLSGSKVEEAFDQLILRVSYVTLFALTLENVPETVPFEKGRLWLDSIKHVLMPRFLFPDKPAVNDSERTNFYTGIKVASAEQGTSIGIGYMAESYIDFGSVGMFAPILLLGCFYGFIYRCFVHHYHLKLLGFALATSILIFGACAIESSNIKLVGGNLMSLLVLGLFALVAGGWFWRLITTPDTARPGHGRARLATVRPARRSRVR